MKTESIIRGIMENLHTALLCGSPTPMQAMLLEDMRRVEIGDLVMESSTSYHIAQDANALGWLREITSEPAFSDWDEEAEGEECPYEKVWYIDTLDGRRFRWTNASFLTVPIDSLGLRESDKYIKNGSVLPGVRKRMRPSLKAERLPEAQHHPESPDQPS